MIYNREQLIGQWFRQVAVENGNQLIEYASFYNDGSFEFCFVTQDSAGNIIEQISELGDWGLVGDIHFTITKNELLDEKLYAAELEHPDNYQAYKVCQLSVDSFSYQHILSNETFILKRVIDNIGHC
ncbi:hypothetical protein [Thalassotalea atypica]|uniref:hypothetical protein n=1 Tax=Thalassotalea atypica TaxID=2054316 RepID=UPI0025724684|nr:hypothetical protein [Thalassotalea atypica]